jgi:hypothetical protein
MQSRSLIAIQSLLLLACAQPPVEAQETFLDRVEAQVRMPDGARPLKAYSRSYFPVQNGAKIMGIYSTLSAPGRRWVAQNPGPFIMDGGCAVITVVIDAATGTIEHVECNGVG